MKEALFNLIDENGQLWAQERWVWFDEIDAVVNNRPEGYRIEIRYFQGTGERSFVEAGKSNANKKRELLTWIT